jgi:hypothetical protein
MKALSLFSLILLLFSSGRQLKTDTKTESAGRLDGIQLFPYQNGRIPAGWLGSGRSPAVLAGDPVISLPDPGQLAGIRPFPGQNGRILADWPGIRPFPG